MKKTRRISLAAIVGATSSLLASAAQADEWEWMLAPYVWASDTTVDLFVNDDPAGGGDLDFSDLLDKLQTAAQLHFEGRKDKFGFLLDYTYLKVTDRTTNDFVAPIPGETTIHVETELGMFEGAGFYRPGGGPAGFDLMLGLRNINVDVDLDLNLPDPLPDEQLSGSETLTDVIVGGRYIVPLSERLTLAFRGDYGTGDSEQTLNLVATLGINFGKSGKFATLLSYRYMDIEIVEGRGDEKVEVDMTMSGPQIGLLIRF